MTKKEIKKIKIENFTYEIPAGQKVIGLISENTKQYSLIFKKGKVPKIFKKLGEI